MENYTDYEWILYKRKQALYHLQLYNYYHNNTNLSRQDEPNIKLENIALTFTKCIGNNHQYFSHHNNRLRCVNCDEYKPDFDFIPNISIDLVYCILKSNINLRYALRATCKELRSLAINDIINNELVISIKRNEINNKLPIFFGCSYDYKKCCNSSNGYANIHVISSVYDGSYIEYVAKGKRIDINTFKTIENKLYFNQIRFSKSKIDTLISKTNNYVFHTNPIIYKEIIKNRAEKIFSIVIGDGKLAVITKRYYDRNMRTLKGSILQLYKYCCCRDEKLVKEISEGNKDKLKEL